MRSVATWRSRERSRKPAREFTASTGRGDVRAGVEQQDDAVDLALLGHVDEALPRGGAGIAGAVARSAEARSSRRAPDRDRAGCAGTRYGPNRRGRRGRRTRPAMGLERDRAEVLRPDADRTEGRGRLRDGLHRDAVADGGVLDRVAGDRLDDVVAAHVGDLGVDADAAVDERDDARRDGVEALRAGRRARCRSPAPRGRGRCRGTARPGHPPGSWWARRAGGIWRRAWSRSRPRAAGGWRPG